MAVVLTAAQVRERAAKQKAKQQAKKKRRLSDGEGSSSALDDDERPSQLSRGAPLAKASQASQGSSATAAQPPAGVPQILLERGPELDGHDDNNTRRLAAAPARTDKPSKAVERVRREPLPPSTIRVESREGTQALTISTTYGQWAPLTQPIVDAGWKSSEQARAQAARAQANREALSTQQYDHECYELARSVGWAHLQRYSDLVGGGVYERLVELHQQRQRPAATG